MIGAAAQHASNEAAVLIGHRLNLSPAQLLAYPEREVAPGEAEWLRAAARRRGFGEPLAYVMGEAWFFGRPYFVDPRVLVPRPETEHLIDEVHARVPRARRALDVGTGSGAIAITLAAEFPELHVTALDISSDALSVAQRNAERHGVAERVDFRRSDLLDALSPDPARAYDVIVANLPYIPAADIPAKPDPVGFEPVLALDGGLDGLALYDRLLAEISPFLAPGAVALFEAAPPTILQLADRVRQSLSHGRTVIECDYAGLARYVVWWDETGEHTGGEKR